MGMKVKGITEQTIRSYWTIFFLVFIFLVVIGVRIWINVRLIPQEPSPIFIEGDLQPPRIKTRVEPVYPPQAKKIGLKAEIQLEVRTDIEGDVVNAKVLNIDQDYSRGVGIWRLYQAAREAVLQWTFEPYNYQGRIWPAVFTVTVKFE